MTGPDERFTGRWSRLKQEAKAPADEPQIASLPTAEEADATAEQTPTIAPEDLPEIDSLDKDSDYTPFLQEGVPEHLKNLALRALWRSDPVLANLDGLNDYDENFKSAMDVGAEFMKKIREAGEKVMGDPEVEETEETAEDDIVAENTVDSPGADDDGADEDPELG
jgi:hypothetical protein